MNCSPAGTQLGARKSIAGPGPTLLAMVNGARLEMPPPGAGLVTSTVSVPSKAMSAAGTAAVNSVALTNALGSADPPKVTTDAVMKPVPVIVSVKAAAPAAALSGERVLTLGMGFDSMGGGV